ncbi:uncharacterized protein [Rutidosis leptorrhynchoides]|uniref:uncharacterized protein n=1 Tax=Rutidosis leptorrhynchoides TaxID=125765 RepID=UPI003A98FF14
MEGLHIDLKAATDANLIKGACVGVSNYTSDLIASRLGCSRGTMPFTYLRLPMGINMNLVSSRSSLIQKFRIRLSNWKSKLLSIGGRVTVIKSVLGSLGIYYLSLFKCPETRFCSDRKGIWSNVIIAIHGSNGGINDEYNGRLGIWKNMIKSFIAAQNSGLIPRHPIRFNVGKGDKIKFWKDIWIGDEPM